MRVRFHARRRRGGRKSDRNERDGEMHGTEQFQTRVAFAPGVRKQIFFRVHIHARGAKSGDGPIDGFGHFRRAGDAAADFIGEAAKIFFQRRLTHHDGRDFGGGLRARGGFCCRAPGGALDGLRGMERIGVWRAAVAAKRESRNEAKKY